MGVSRLGSTSTDGYELKHGPALTTLAWAAVPMCTPTSPLRMASTVTATSPVRPGQRAPSGRWLRWRTAPTRWRRRRRCRRPGHSTPSHVQSAPTVHEERPGSVARYATRSVPLTMSGSSLP